MLKEITLPDIGAYSNVDIIEILVKEGERIAKDASLITLETDKATMEIPSPLSGIVKSLHIKLGDKVSAGELILTLEVEENIASDSNSKETVAVKESNEKNNQTPIILKEVVVPDIGNYSNVDVIEILIKVGDRIKKDDSIITLETDKATMEIPSPFSGIVKSLDIKVGDKVSAGNKILTLELTEALESTGADSAISVDSKVSNVQTAVEANKQTQTISQVPIPIAKSTTETTSHDLSINTQGVVHAGPGVRRFARELGVDLTKVAGTGRKNRILIIDVQVYVKNELKRLHSSTAGTAGSASFSGVNIAPWPTIDHAKFGEISKEPLSRIKKLTGSFLHRNWVMVPHVTQFDEADITELEVFRKESQSLADEGVKLTPLVFIMKAVTAALEAFPSFNASLDASGQELILKKYFHIGVAVDTPQGLVVPVVRQVDQKGLFQLAKELGEISQKARLGQLKAEDMQGSSFSISSLGGIGGTAFTPIINVPDVAILGVSKAQMKPIYTKTNEGGEFLPRLMLPLSLSYDHRVIDGAEAARFITFLAKQLSDIRRLLL